MRFAFESLSRGARPMGVVINGDINGDIQQQQLSIDYTHYTAHTHSTHTHLRLWLTFSPMVPSLPDSQINRDIEGVSGVPVGRPQGIQHSRHTDLL